MKVKADRFEDQSLDIATAPMLDRDREQEKTEPRWVATTSDKLYFWRSSRDLHRIDVCVADTATGDVKTLIEERLNTYVETPAAVPRQRRRGAHPLVRARRLGPLLPVRRRRHS